MSHNNNEHRELTAAELDMVTGAGNLHEIPMASTAPS